MSLRSMFTAFMIDISFIRFMTLRLIWEVELCHLWAKSRLVCVLTPSDEDSMGDQWHGRLCVSSVYPQLCIKTLQSLYTTANPNLFESFSLGLQMMWFVHRASISKWMFVKAPSKFWCSHNIRVSWPSLT